MRMTLSRSRSSRNIGILGESDPGAVGRTASKRYEATDWLTKDTKVPDPQIDSLDSVMTAIIRLPYSLMKSRVGHVNLHEQAEYHLGQFRCFGNIDDIEKAIEYRACALDLTPSGHPSTLLRISCLRVYYDERYRRLGNLIPVCIVSARGKGTCDAGREDWDTETRGRLAGRVAVHPGSEEAGWVGKKRIKRGIRAVTLHRLRATPYNLDGLNKSMEYDIRALELTPDNDPRLPTRLDNMRISYEMCYDHSDLPQRHSELGVAHTDRYRRMGEPADLENSIECYCRALAHTPDGHPCLPRRHADLGASYTHQYRRTGDPADLEKSIEHHSHALDLTPDGHPDLPDRHADLGVAYTDRYRRMGEPADLEMSIECKSRALVLTPDGHPDLPRRHSDLGVAYTYRYRRMGEAVDLEKSIEYKSRALALTPDGHSDLPQRHSELGVAHTDRYRRMGEPADLENSIECYCRALALTPDAHPDLPVRHTHLGVVDRVQFSCARPHSRRPSLPTTPAC
ncbi:Sel1 domain-containing protein [Rhizoctonia solani AG-1 IA]|uniref:Sel1 domain-containing protein n=1 Tax=Thanatephorus cucumeris (strain AG1-IA) TaxID=983506 RepID=L8WJW5_THACA|nr:Sel1 domain-containing protein [Rhizoctonia solani AG-1 IA]